MNSRLIYLDVSKKGCHGIKDLTLSLCKCKKMSWITDLFASLTTCLQRTWMRPSYNPPESRMEMGLKPREEIEDLYDISLDTGTPHHSKWSSLNFTSKCQSTSQDNTCDIAWPVSTNSPPATPSYRNSTTNQTFYADNPK